jgi:hypothetical protein
MSNHKKHKMHKKSVFLFVSLVPFVVALPVLSQKNKTDQIE